MPTGRLQQLSADISEKNQIKSNVSLTEQQKQL